MKCTVCNGTKTTGTFLKEENKTISRVRPTDILDVIITPSLIVMGTRKSPIRKVATPTPCEHCNGTGVEPKNKKS